MVRKSYKTLYESAQKRIDELNQRIWDMDYEAHKFGHEYDYWKQMIETEALSYEKAIEICAKLLKLTAQFGTTRFDKYAIMQVDSIKNHKDDWKDVFIQIIGEYETFVGEAEAVIEFFSENHIS
jgi:hypothetical protein